MYSLSEGYKYCVHEIWCLEPTCRKAETQRICMSLVKIKDREKTKTDVHVKEAKQTEDKSTQKVTQEFFMKKSDKPLHNLDILQNIEAELGQTVATGQQVVWSIKQMVVRAEIIATLHFAAQNLSFSSSQNLSACNCKKCNSWTQ